MSRIALGQFKPLDPREYLYSKIAVDEATGCWNWTGHLFEKGYGYFKCVGLEDQAIPASRASWKIHNGDISRYDFVCHKCDNRACCNPAHLFLGTQKQNMQDCVAKERINRGENRPQHKLTEPDVVELRRARRTGESWRSLATKYGVAVNCIVSAVTGVTWKHVPEPVIRSGRKAA